MFCLVGLVMLLFCLVGSICRCRRPLASHCETWLSTHAETSKTSSNFNGVKTNREEQNVSEFFLVVSVCLTDMMCEFGLGQKFMSPLFL